MRAPSSDCTRRHRESSARWRFVAVGRPDCGPPDTENDVTLWQPFTDSGSELPVNKTVAAGETINPEGWLPVLARVGEPEKLADSRHYRTSSRCARPRCCSSNGRRTSSRSHGGGTA